MTNYQVSLQCPTAEYPCSALPQSILTLPNDHASLQCPTAEDPCSAQPPSIPAVPNRRVFFWQSSTTKYPCSAQPPSIPAVPNCKASLECPTAKYHHFCSAFAVLRKAVDKGQGNVIYTFCAITALRWGKRCTSCAITAVGWGCSKKMSFLGFEEPWALCKPKSENAPREN